MITSLGQQRNVLLKLTCLTDNYVNFVEKSVTVDYGEMPYLSSSSGSRIYLYLDGVYGRPERDYVGTFGIAPAELRSLNWLVPIFTGSVGGMRSSEDSAYTVNQYARDVREMLVQEGAESVAIFGFSMGSSIALHLLGMLGEIQVEGVFHYEGNLDANDTYFTKRMAAQEPEEIILTLREWDPELPREATEFAVAVQHRARSLVELSESGRNLAMLLDSDAKHHFLYGELNRGKLSSQHLLQDHGFEIVYVPCADHWVMSKNPGFVHEYVNSSLGI